jgi:acyl carrier protein
MRNQHNKTKRKTNMSKNLKWQALFEKTQEIIANQLDVSVDQVAHSTSIVDDLGADSLAVVELILAAEEAFEIDIPDEDTESLATVKDLVDYLYSKGVSL